MQGHDGVGSEGDSQGRAALKVILVGASIRTLSFEQLREPPRRVVT